MPSPQGCRRRKITGDAAQWGRACLSGPWAQTLHQTTTPRLYPPKAKPFYLSETILMASTWKYSYQYTILLPNMHWLIHYYNNFQIFSGTSINTVDIKIRRNKIIYKMNSGFEICSGIQLIFSKAVMELGRWLSQGSTCCASVGL